MHQSAEPWGKLARDAPVGAFAARLSLVGHCIDVAATFLALAFVPVIRARLVHLAGRDLTHMDVMRLVVLAFLHDVGKCSAGFYAKCLPPDELRAWTREHGIGFEALGHVRVVNTLFKPGDLSRRLADAVGVEDIMDWHDPNLPAEQPALWFAAISHHGLPVNGAYLQNNAQAAPDVVWTATVGDYVPLDGLKRLGTAARNLFPDAWAAGSVPLPATPAFTHAFAGMVSLADWIGSNANAEFFPYDLGADGAESGAAQDESRWPVARVRAAEVLRRMRVDLTESRAELARRSPNFAAMFGFAPHAAQAACGDLGLASIAVLESETGSGKTEAALWRFKTLFESGVVDALAFLLPTRVSATAIHKRVTGFMERLFPNPDLRPQVVLAVPGYMRVNDLDAARVLPGFEVLWPDDDADGARSAGHAGHAGGRESPTRPIFWAAENSKRYFCAPAAVGTVDQLLLSAMEVKHSHMRASALLRALVVVDEVHASDAYMGELLRVALARHASAGGHALLLSATLTGEARSSFIAAGAAQRLSSVRMALLADRDAPYPCLSDVEATRRLVDASAPVAEIAQKTVTATVMPLAQESGAVAALVAQAVGAGAKVLVIRNTVGLALQTQREIERLIGTEHPALFRCRSVVAMHHGRYHSSDRRLLDAEVEVVYGKAAAKSRQAAVLVGTQTLEISLDCDADLLVTDIAPMDVLLQRIGRLHRHAGRNGFRPAGFDAPTVVVLRPQDRDLGALLGKGTHARGAGIGPRSAYENLISVEATLQQLESRGVLVIPADNRALVEASVDTETLFDLAASLGGPWPEHAQSLFGKKAAQAGQAWRRSMPWSRPWSELSAADALDEAVRTRLGLDGRQFEIGQRWTTPFGADISNVTVPGWMLPPGPMPDGVDVASADEGSLHFEVGGRRFLYDRLGLALLRE